MKQAKVIRIDFWFDLDEFYPEKVTTEFVLRKLRAYGLENKGVKLVASDQGTMPMLNE